MLESICHGGSENGGDYNFLGTFYYEGLGVERNVEKAIDCYEKAALLGLPEAVFNLGAIYENGKGVPVNFLKSVEYFEQFLGLEKEDEGLIVKAKLTLSHHYLNGTGARKDLDRAKEYAHQAKKKLEKFSEKAPDKIQEAFNLLAHCALEEKNYEEARAYFDQAFEHGACERDVLHDAALAYVLDIQASTEIRKKGLKLLKQASQKGDKLAQENLGVMFAYGNYVDCNLNEARKLLSPLAAEGSFRAKLALRVVQEKLEEEKKKAGVEDGASDSSERAQAEDVIEIVDEFETDSFEEEKAINANDLDRESPEIEGGSTEEELDEEQDEEYAVSHVFIKRDAVEKILSPSFLSKNSLLQNASDKSLSFLEDFFAGGAKSKLKMKGFLRVVMDLGCSVTETKSGYKIQSLDGDGKKSIFTFHQQHKGSHAHFWSGVFRSSLKNFFNNIGITEDGVRGKIHGN